MPGGPQLSTQRSSGHLPCGLLHPSKVNAYLLSRFLGVKELGAGSHQLPTLGPLSMFSLCPECPGLLKPLVISTWHTLLILSDPVNASSRKHFLISSGALEALLLSPLHTRFLSPLSPWAVMIPREKKSDIL